MNSTLFCIHVYNSLIKAYLWRLLQSGVSLLPERLRLMILMQPLLLPLGCGDIRLIVDSDREYYGRRRADAEPETLRWIRESIHSPSVFYDIGANVGVYSLIAAHHYPGIHIIAFEPAAPNYNILVRNLALNHATNVWSLPLALGAVTSMNRFAYSTLRSGGALHRVGGETGYGYPIPVFRMDDLIRTFRLPPPTHLKIDVDGTERDVLSGATETIKTVQSVLIEINGDPTNILTWFHQQGFQKILQGKEHPTKRNANYWLERKKSDSI